MRSLQQTGLLGDPTWPADHGPPNLSAGGLGEETGAYPGVVMLAGQRLWGPCLGQLLLGEDRAVGPEGKAQSIAEDCGSHCPQPLSQLSRLYCLGVKASMQSGALPVCAGVQQGRTVKDTLKNRLLTLSWKVQHSIPLASISRCVS